MDKIDWKSLLFKIFIVAGLAIVVWYLTAGSNIAVIATVAAVGVGIWFAFFRKKGPTSNGSVMPNGNGARSSVKPARA